MCKSCGNQALANNVPAQKYHLSDFFQAHWDAYRLFPTKYIEPEQYKAVNAILKCRTEALGKDLWVCERCGDISEVLLNCKNRFCPRCSWLDTVKWAERIKSEIYNIPHRHVVFTLPHSLIPLIEKNKKLIYNLMGRVSADTLKDWILAKYKINCGIISVLHTFGEKKNLHVHVHMIVSWGGQDCETQELKKIDDIFVKYEFLQKKFRIKFEDELVKFYDDKKLDHNFLNRGLFLSFLKKINKKNWQIHFEPPMATPAEVIRYIGRYSKRCCLSEYKITNIDGEYLTFKYKDYKEKDANGKAVEKELRLHYRDFFPLLLQHVPPSGLRLVKNYGKYARTKKIPADFKSPIEKVKISEQLEDDFETSDENPKYCKLCNCQKTYFMTIYKPLSIKGQPDSERIEFDKNILKKNVIKKKVA